MRVGPVAITNGVFGNRPHCIYRGFCLQGCKVNAKASPLITHLPDAIANGVEVRADSHVARVEVDEAGRCTGVVYLHDGREHFQRAAVVVVAGYSIESPRLLLNSTSARFPHGLANNNDQVGRYVMVQGLAGGGQVPATSHTSTRRRRPRSARRSTTRRIPQRGFARGFSIQTVGPLPIGWAEHVLADGHWGHALREYMRDYNHWSTLGLLCELLPQPDNRVTLAEEKDSHGLPVAHFSYSQCENDRANIAYGKTRARTDLGGGRRRRTRSTIDRYAHLVGGCRMGASPDSSRRRRRPPRLGGPEPVRLRRQRDADAGVGEPGADDHGAGLAVRRADRGQAGWGGACGERPKQRRGRACVTWRSP